MALNLSEADTSDMGFERHPEYLHATQIFRLTRGCLAYVRRYTRKALKGAVFLGILHAGASSTWAAEEPGETPDEVVQVVVDEATCRALSRYTDAGAADYRPGVDAYGRPVAGANLSDQPTDVVPHDITFTLTVRLAEFAPGLANSLTDSAAPIGEVTIRNGDAFLNGRSLGQSQSNAVAVACRERLRQADE